MTGGTSGVACTAGVGWWRSEYLVAIVDDEHGTLIDRRTYPAHGISE